MRHEALRTGWPDQILNGQYAFRTYGDGAGAHVLSALVELATAQLFEPEPHARLHLTIDGKQVMLVLKDKDNTWQPPGIKVIGTEPRGPYLTLLQHVSREDEARPPTSAVVLAPLFDRRYTFRNRLRRAASEWRWAGQRKSRPVLQTWDVLDNRLGRVIGRLTRPAGGLPANTRTVVYGATGRLNALMVEPAGAPARYLTFLVDDRPVAHIAEIHGEYRVDVTHAGPAGLDPRLVLAAAILELAHLSDG